MGRLSMECGVSIRQVKQLTEKPLYKKSMIRTRKRAASCELKMKASKKETAVDHEIELVKWTCCGAHEAHAA